MLLGETIHLAPIPPKPNVVKSTQQPRELGRYELACGRENTTNAMDENMNDTAIAPIIAAAITTIGGIIVTIYASRNNPGNKVSHENIPDDKIVRKIFDNNEDYLYALKLQKQRILFTKHYKYFFGPSDMSLIVQFHKLNNSRYSFQEIINNAGWIDDLPKWLNGKRWRQTIRILARKLLLMLLLLLAAIFLYHFYSLFKTFITMKLLSFEFAISLAISIATLAITIFEIMYLRREARGLKIQIDFYASANKDKADNL